VIIDFSSHIVTSPVEKALADKKGFGRIKNNFAPDSSDPERRIRLMDKYRIDIQVLTQTTPVLEGLNPEEASEICAISNDAIGDICRAYPNRYVPFAVVSLLDVPTAAAELERAVAEWGCRGVTIGTNHDNRGLDAAENDPFWDLVSRLDIPVFLHPMSWQKYNLVDDDPAVMRLFGWPFDTTQALLRLVLSGTMERFPNLKIVSHHLGGGLIPFFAGRFDVKFEKLKKTLNKPYKESFANIYADTAVDGSAAALPCGHAFWGTERMVFGTDYPFSPEDGELYYRENIRIMKEWSLSDAEKEKIWSGNAIKLLKL
jgi:uncharacterized protein